jgi:hypothetical protein
MYTGFSRFDGRLFPVVVVKLAELRARRWAATSGQAVVELGCGRAAWRAEHGLILALGLGAEEEWRPAVCAAGAAAGIEASGARRPAGERGGCGSWRGAGNSWAGACSRARGREWSWGQEQAGDWGAGTGASWGGVGRGAAVEAGWGGRWRLDGGSCSAGGGVDLRQGIQEQGERCLVRVELGGSKRNVDLGRAGFSRWVGFSRSEVRL